MRHLIRFTIFISLFMSVVNCMKVTPLNLEECLIDDAVDYGDSHFVFEIVLYEDLNGEPGEVIPYDVVEVGDTFFLEVAAEDIRDPSHGIMAISFDLDWDASALEVITDPFDPEDPDSPLMTSKLPTYRFGTLEEGRILDLTGVTFSGSVGRDNAETLSLIHFRANGEIENSPITMVINAGGAQDGVMFKDSLLYTDPQIITVVPQGEKETYIDNLPTTRCLR